MENESYYSVFEEPVDFIHEQRIFKKTTEYRLSKLEKRSTRLEYFIVITSGLFIVNKIVSLIRKDKQFINV
jgi:hypothetical protein